MTFSAPYVDGRGESAIWTLSLGPSDWLSVKATALSGQVFRYGISEEGVFLYSRDRRALVRETEGGVFLCAPERRKSEACATLAVFQAYLDVERDYAADIESLRSLGFPEDILLASRGVGLFRQDPEEAIFSFLISQNNHIARIRKSVENLCLAFGELREDKWGRFYTFPAALAIARQTSDRLRDMGVGYRDRYLLETARMLVDHPGWIESVSSAPTEDARRMLRTLPGVGPKVADCILLYGFGRGDVFPLDTWMRKVYRERFGPDGSYASMHREAVSRYQSLSGLAQQLFFSERRSRKPSSKKFF